MQSATLLGDAFRSVISHRRSLGTIQQASDLLMTDQTWPGTPGAKSRVVLGPTILVKGLVGPSVPIVHGVERHPMGMVLDLLENPSVSRLNRRIPIGMARFWRST